MNAYGHYLERAARLFADRPAVVDGDRRLTFQELFDRTGSLAAAVRDLGARRGDRVVDIGDNRLAAVEIDFALARGGQVRVSLPEFSSFEQHAAMVSDCAPTLVVCGPGWAEYGRRLVQASPGVRALIVEGEDVELQDGEIAYDEMLERSPAWRDLSFDGHELLSLRYTGGTTGLPKGVMRTHIEQITAATSVLMDLCPLRDDDVVVHSTPLSHGANAFVLPAVMRGALQVVGPAFDADAALELIERHRGTFTKVVPPTGIRSLVEARLREPGASRDLSSLRLIVSGSAALPGPVLQEAVEVFGPIIGQTYGQTESPLGIVRCAPEELLGTRDARGLHPTGRPYTLTDVAIRTGDGRLTCEAGTTGELVVRSVIPFGGYWGRSDEVVDHDGWRATGDIGRFDADGYLYMLGRAEELLGDEDEPVSARVVEEALYSHPSVREVAVVQLVVGGRRAVAAIVACRTGHRTDEDTLRAVCAGLPAGAVPERVVIVDDIPKSPTGKILRRQAADLLRP